MSLSVCCQAKTLQAYEGSVCTTCGRLCREFSPPCDICGSNGPCSCGNSNYLEDPKRGAEILDAVAPLFESKQMYPNHPVGQKINTNSDKEGELTDLPF